MAQAAPGPVRLERASWYNECAGSDAARFKARRIYHLSSRSPVELCGCCGRDFNDLIETLFHARLANEAAHAEYLPTTRGTEQPEAGKFRPCHAMQYFPNRYICCLGEMPQDGVE